MPSHFADRMLEAIRRTGTPAVVALDPVFENLPIALRAGITDESQRLGAITAFAERVLTLIAPHVPCVKINSAYFEAYHADGIVAFDDLMRQARRLGLLTLADVKRGDVGHTAEMYSLAHLGSGEGDAADSPDAVTISGYFGLDGVKPFVDRAVKQGQGVFVLVRTSNPSASVIQDVPLADGMRVHEWVGRQVAEWAEQPGAIGVRGYSLVGAVAATRDAMDARRLRDAMPRCLFLAPGYGAQGGRVEDFAPYFKTDGTGALVVAGRSVIFAYEKDDARGGAGGWEKSVEQACRVFTSDVARLIRRN